MSLSELTSTFSEIIKKTHKKHRLSDDFQGEKKLFNSLKLAECSARYAEMIAMVICEN